MTRNEFKAWFDGFTENIPKIPNQRQWKRIIERVGEINDDEVIRERIIERRRDWWPPYYTWSTPNYILGNSGGGTYTSQPDSNPPLETTITCNATAGDPVTWAANQVGIMEAKQLS